MSTTGGGPSLLRFRGRWALAAAAVAVAFYAVALSSGVYELTSPPWLSWHVLLRKAYSIVAFAIVAYVTRLALREGGYSGGPLRIVLFTAAYSAAIEAGQYAAGTREGLAWNTIDVVCGAIGGLVACRLRLPPIRP